jgi:hypothetical protein
MTGFPETPTGAPANDIRILFDKFRALRDEVGDGDLDVVTDRGATTTNSITVGSSVFMRSGSNVAEFRLTAAGRVELYVNGTVRWSA